MGLIDAGIDPIAEEAITKWSTYDVDPGKEYKLAALSDEITALALPTLIGINEVAGVGLRFIFDEQKAPLDAINSINTVIQQHDPAAPSLAEQKDVFEKQVDAALGEYIDNVVALRSAAEGAKDVVELQAVVVKLVDVTTNLIDLLYVRR